MGELINCIAEEFTSLGMCREKAIIKAELEVREAMIESLNYKYMPKRDKDFRYRIRYQDFKGIDKERKIIRDLSEIMAEFGLVEGDELYSYIVDAINIEKNVHVWIDCHTWDRQAGRRPSKEPSANNIFDFIIKEICRIEQNKINDFGGCFYDRRS